MTDLDNPETGNESVDLLMQESALKGSQRIEHYPGRKFFGYFCSYFPEELVLAAGMEPFRLLPASANATPAELPTYCCSLARGTLAMVNKGEFRDLTGVGFAHTCDTMQCLGGIWENSVTRESTLIMVPPVMLNAPGASSYYKTELHHLYQRLGEINGMKVTEKGLQEAWQLCEQIRSLAAELDELSFGLPSDWVSALLRAGQLMPREDYAKALAKALDELKKLSAEYENRQRILVSGAVLENDNLFRMIEVLGGRVVADDTCTGYRHFSRVAYPEEGDALDWIVQRYIEMPPCPCRNHGLEERTDYLVQLARKRSVTGVILVTRKYCEPHAWDTVPMTMRLRSEGIRTLVLELEGADVGGQERTRIQAFIESL